MVGSSLCGWLHRITPAPASTVHQCRSEQVCHIIFSRFWFSSRKTTVIRYCVTFCLFIGPCSASGLVGSSICGTNLGNLTWVGGVGALFYTAVLVSSDSDSISCTSNTNSCVVKLACDTNYTATVISSTGLCNSTGNSSTQFKSGKQVIHTCCLME